MPILEYIKKNLKNIGCHTFQSILRSHFSGQKSTFDSGKLVTGLAPSGNNKGIKEGDKYFLVHMFGSRIVDW